MYVTADACAVAASVALVLLPAVEGDDPYCCFRCSPKPLLLVLFHDDVKCMKDLLPLTHTLRYNALLHAAALLCLVCLVSRTEIHKGAETKNCCSVVCQRSLHDDTWRWEAVGNGISKEVAVVLVEVCRLVGAWFREGMTCVHQLWDVSTRFSQLTCVWNPQQEI